MTYRKLHGLFILVLFVSLFACNSNHKDEMKTNKVKKTPLVAVKKVHKQDISNSITLIGTVKPNTVGTIKSPADGVVEKLNVRETQHVSKGQIVAVINPTARIALIAKNKQIILQIESGEKTAANKDSLKIFLDKAKADLELAKKMYQLIPVTAELSGIVNERFIDIGSQVSNKDKLIEIYKPNSLVIKAEVNEKYFLTLKKGKKLPIKLSAYPNKKFTGVISLIYPKIDKISRSICFDIKIKEKVKLMEGMTAEIQLITQKHTSAVCVPNDALLTDVNDKAFIFIVDKDSLAHKVLVKPGISTKNMTEILSGLNENQMVVIKGQERLKEGKKVKILSAKKNKK